MKKTMDYASKKPLNPWFKSRSSKIFRVDGAMHSHALHGKAAQSRVRSHIGICTSSLAQHLYAHFAYSKKAEPYSSARNLIITNPMNRFMKHM